MTGFNDASFATFEFLPSQPAKNVEKIRFSFDKVISHLPLLIFSLKFFISVSKKVFLNTFSFRAASRSLK